MSVASNPSEFKSAFEQFQSFLDPREIDSLQPFGPATVYTPYIVVWLMVYQRLHANATLQSAVSELLGWEKAPIDHKRFREGTLSPSTAAYSAGRKRLSLEAADQIANRIYDTLMAATAPSFRDYRVFILDGSTVSRTPTAELLAAFPPATNQHGSSAWPILHLLVAHELASGCAITPEIGAKYGPEAVGEVTLAKRLIERLPGKSLLIADRNFGTFDFAFSARQKGLATLTRLTERRFRAMQRLAKPDGKGRWQLDWKPSRAMLRKHPDLPADALLKIWIYEVQVKPDLSLWMMSCLEAEGAELAELYQKRQDVETDIRNVKVILKTESIRGKSVAMVKKELAMAMVAYNLVVQVRRLAAQKAKVEPRRISFTGTWDLVRVILLRGGDWTAEQWQARFGKVLRAAARRKIPNRPGRSYERSVIPRGRKHPNRKKNAKPKITK